MSVDLHDYTEPAAPYANHSPRRHAVKPSVLRKLLWLIAGVVVGLFLGAAGAFIQADRFHINTVLIPYGAVLALLMFVISGLYVAREFQSRWPVIGMAIGWVLGTIMMAVETATGDLAISVSNRATGYLIAGSIFGGLVAAMPPMRRPVLQLNSAEIDVDEQPDNNRESAAS